MWSLLSLKNKLTVTLFPSLLLFLLFISLGFSYIQSASYSVTTMFLIALIFGKVLWKKIYCHCAFLQLRFCPDFNGNWEGSVNSNFNGGKNVVIKIKIESDLFTIKMTADTTIGFSYANYCRVIKDENNQFYLEYFFKGINTEPEETDDATYLGAARVRVVDLHSMRMKGPFWTNRCWQRGLNTAGIIEFTKID